MTTAAATESRAGIVLCAERLTMRFGRGDRAVTALDDVSLVAREAAVTGLLGPDGAGKTTLLRLAAGLLVPTSGRLGVLDLDSVTDTDTIRRRIGYMPQKFGLYEDLTVQENLDLYADLQGVPMALRDERYEQLMHMTGLGPFTKRLAGRLSGGMKQKLGLACCLVKSPDMLLLDEPTVGVDPVSRRDLWEIVYRLVEQDGIGVVLSTAYLDEAERCDDVVMLHEGRKLAEGKPRDFYERVRGRVFLVEPTGDVAPRDLQSELAYRDEVVDATIRSGRVRAVLKSAEAAEHENLSLDGVATCRAVEPVFEDAFVDLLAAEGVVYRLSAPSESGTPQDDSRGEDDEHEAIVRVRDLTKKFGDFTAVQNISFEVRRGEIFGLLGPNGAGKTTTFRMLCGLLSSSGGEIRVADHDLRRAGSEARAHLGYMAQKFSLYQQLSVGQNLQFYGRAYGLYGRRLRQRIDWALDEFDLAKRRDLPAGDLPGGYRQRLAMAAAMLHEPDILFLDEPTSGADPLARREFWLRINGFAHDGVTVIVTTHFMEEAEYCDRMLIMSRGTEMAQGTPAAIRALARTPENPEPTIEDAFIALAEGRVEPPLESPQGGPNDG